LLGRNKYAIAAGQTINKYLLKNGDKPEDDLNYF
jgi:hypothetical protein